MEEAGGVEWSGVLRGVLFAAGIVCCVTLHISGAVHVLLGVLSWHGKCTHSSVLLAAAQNRRT